MKITKISLKHFRAFYAEHEINLGKRGQNLLIYGENGSGKSSLLKAIELFIDSHVKDIAFATHRNFFADPLEGGHVKISMRSSPQDPETTYEWSETTRETHAPIILDASKTRGSLDYKSLLEIYFLQPKDCEINLFDILINVILGNSINALTNKRFSDEWSEIKQCLPHSTRHTRIIEDLEIKIDAFNVGLRNILNQLRSEASSILNGFGYPILLDFFFQGITFNRDTKSLNGNEVLLSVKFRNTSFPLAHQFLNEAKLSAISLSIYLSALQINPSSDLKVLVLDDVLIGLDMSNRLPIIDILKARFDDYQIFLMTYDKEWYEILKRNFTTWKAIEIYVGHGTDHEMPILVETKKYLDKAQSYLDANDHKAAAIYLRTAFEVKIKEFCEKRKLLVTYRQKPKDLTTDDFLKPIKDKKCIDESLAFDIELYRSFIMNPLSHSQLVNAPKREIQDAINTVKKLENALDEIINEKRSKNKSY